MKIPNSSLEYAKYRALQGPRTIQSTHDHLCGKLFNPDKKNGVEMVYFGSAWLTMDQAKFLRDEIQKTLPPYKEPSCYSFLAYNGA